MCGEGVGSLGMLLGDGVSKAKPVQAGLSNWYFSVLLTEQNLAFSSSHSFSATYDADNHARMLHSD
jgi:hypothetical protein